MLADWNIFIAAIGFGAGWEALRRYREFKARRAIIPYITRNSGFWTDLRLYRAEAIFSSIAMGAPWTAIILAVSTNGNLWLTYASVLAYTGAVYILMSSLQPRYRQ